MYFILVQRVRLLLPGDLTQQGPPYTQQHVAFILLFGEEKSRRW